MLDCKISVEDDTASLSGQVTEAEKPAARHAIVLIPQSRALRRMPRYTLTAHSDSAGQYRIAGVIPGDYFLFAVSPSDDHSYFAVDFADRHQASAVRFSVRARAAQVVNLKPSSAQ